MSSNRYRWVILMVSYLAMLSFAFTLQAVPPVLTLIIRDLGLSHARAGVLMSLFALPAVFLSLIAGLLSDRIGAFRVGTASLVLVVAGNVILALSGSFFTACLGRVVSGIGASTASIVAAQVLSHWFRGFESGTAMGIFNTAMPVGTIVSFTFFGRLAERYGWRAPVYIPVAVGALALLVFLLLYRPAGGAEAGRSQAQSGDKQPLLSAGFSLGLPVLLLGLSWMWFNAAVISFTTFAADFFVSKGRSIGEAGFSASLLMWAALVLSPFIGRMVDKTGKNVLFIGGSGMLIAAAIVYVSRASDFLAPILLLSVALSLTPVSVFAFPARLTQPQSLGIVFGVLLTASSVGMFFGPFTAGLVRDATGNYEAAFTYLAGLALLIGVTALVLGAVLRIPRFLEAHAIRAGG